MRLWVYFRHVWAVVCVTVSESDVDVCEIAFIVLHLVQFQRV